MELFFFLKKAYATPWLIKTSKALAQLQMQYENNLCYLLLCIGKMRRIANITTPKHEEV